MENRNILNLHFGLNCAHKIDKPYDCFHRHNEIELAFFTKGEPIIYRFGGKIVEIKNRQSILFWGAIPHQILSLSEDNYVYWLTIPPEVFLRWELPKDFVRKILNGKILTEIDDELRDIDILKFPIWHKEIYSKDTERHKNAAMDIQTRLRRFSMKEGKANEYYFSPSNLNREDKNSFMIMYDFITTNYKSTLYIEDIARSAHLNPNYAHTLFKSKCGITITDLITMLRVYESQRLLLTTDMKIVDIAMEAGFGSVSSFYKSFRKIIHVNPCSYRKIREEPLL